MSYQKMRMFLVSVTILPQKEGMDMPRFLQKLGNLLTGYSSASNVVYKFKVSGESKILSVVQVVNVIGFERTLSGLVRLGAVEVECTPIIPYEQFARRLEVEEKWTSPNTGTLAKEGLYWLEFNVGYGGKSTDELVQIWKREAEAVLKSRTNEGASIELFKVVAERKVHVFMNTLDPGHVDNLSLQLPIMKENGANVAIKCKALQLLDDYNQRIIAESI